MFERVPGTRPNMSESHSEISTRVPFCIEEGVCAQVRFPDGTIVQGVFLPNESVDKLYELVPRLPILTPRGDGHTRQTMGIRMTLLTH